MHKYFIYLALCLITTFFSSAYSQSKPVNKHKRPLSKKTHKLPQNTPSDCIETRKYSLKQRLKHYPFNKAAKIVAVSYMAEMSFSMSQHMVKDTSELFTKQRLSGLHFRKNGMLDSTTLIEAKTLNKSQINQLTNIIYNISNSKPSVSPGTKCAPYYRNALIYIDKNDKIFDYMEICFECGQTYSKSGRLYLGDDCNQKYNIVKKFLKSVGINYVERDDREKITPKVTN